MNTRQTIGKVAGRTGSAGSRGLADCFSSEVMLHQARMISGGALIFSQPQTRCNYPRRRLRYGALILLFSACLGTIGAYAQDATWTGGGTGDWNTPSSWSTNTVPMGIATFGAAPITAVTVSPPTAPNITPIDTLQFKPGAPAYSFNITAGTLALTGVANLNITGSGILNGSSNAPTITISEGGQLNLFANATADNAVIITEDGGITVFNGNSTAGTANITNNGGVVIGPFHTGSIEFASTSTAANSTITANNNAFVAFIDTSSGGQARFIINSGSFFDISGLTSTGIAAGSIEGAGTFQLGSKMLTVGTNNQSTEVSGNIVDGGFFGGTGAGLTKVGSGTLTLSGNNTYTAGTFITEGTLQIGDTVRTGSIAGDVANSSNFFVFNADTTGITTITNSAGGVTQFFNANSASTATITNSDGETDFNQTSTAENANITNNSGGITRFLNQSTAAVSNITNSGGETQFLNTSTAANAIINNDSGGIAQFNGTSTAGSATINNQSGGTTQFLDASTAGSAIIGIAPGGQLLFNNASGAGSAIITNSGGLAQFFDTSTAANSTILVNGGTTQFSDNSTAENSTITTNTGGVTKFFDVSTGGQARFITTLGGIVDISNLTSAGMTAGSIEGAGNYELGSKALTVGLNNLSTTVSGTIVDGGSGDGTGGSLIKVGTGTLTLTGSNTYTGGTSFNGGVVAVNSDVNLGTGPLSFNGGTLEALATGGGVTSTKAIALKTLGGRFLADAATTSTLSGAISGAGSLTKDGLGTLVLSGANIYTGGTVLQEGTLTVKGTQPLGLGDVVVNGGILNADPQSINVKGNYVQKSGGTLQLQVAGAHPGQYDSLNVGGNASLGGTLQLISLGFQPKAGDLLTLVTTGRGVSGRFAQFVDPFANAPGFTFVGLVYEANSVLLEFRTAASLALTPNQLAAANLLDAVHQDPRAANLISSLQQKPFDNLPGDFEKISPDGLTAFYEISFSNANIQRLNLESRMDDLHNGTNGFSSNMKVNGATVNLEARADADGKSSKAVVEPILQPGPGNRWGVWMTGFGDFVSVDGDANANGYNFTTGGVSLGIDYRLTDELAVGVMAEYSHTWTSLQEGGNIDVNSGRGGVYATWSHHGFYLNGAIYGGYNSYNSSRSALQGLASGNTEGAEFSTFISGGYDFHLGLLTVGPLAALQYTYVNIDGFGENGSLAPMQIQSDSVDSLRSDVGFRLFYPWQVGKVIIEPSLKAAWEHEYLYSALPVIAGFANSPGPVATFVGPAEGHDSAIVSAGVSVIWTPTLTTYLNYDGQLGRGNYSSNAATGGVRISF